MPQAVWIGDLSFGLVSIPVKIYSATSPKQVRFHHYEAGTGRRIRYARVASGPAATHSAPGDETRSEPPEADEPADEVEFQTTPGTEDADEEVPWDEVVKGYEVEPGKVVTVTPEELVLLAPERSRVLEVEQFIDLEDIDPVHFDKSYHVVPQAGATAERPYWLLYRAMEAASKVAVGRFVMRRKEYLVAVRPAEHVLMLETLFYADEVRDPKDVWVPLIEEPPERELRVAEQFVDALAGAWEPERHRDNYRERILELLHSKAGEALVVPDLQEDGAPPPAVDLMKALQASVEAARRARRDQKKDAG